MSINSSFLRKGRRHWRCVCFWFVLITIGKPQPYLAWALKTKIKKSHLWMGFLFLIIISSSSLKFEWWEKLTKRMTRVSTLAKIWAIWKTYKVIQGLSKCSIKSPIQKPQWDKSNPPTPPCHLGFSLVVHLLTFCYNVIQSYDRNFKLLLIQ